MVTFSWIAPAAGAAGLLVSAQGALANLQRPNHHHDGRAAPRDSIVPNLLARFRPVDTSRNGNWTKISCMDELSQHPYNHTAQERWRGLAADGAWNEAVRIWNTTGYSTEYSAFHVSVRDTFGVEGLCGRFEKTACDESLQCSHLEGLDAHLTGPGAVLVWNSLVTISAMHSGYIETLKEAANNFNNTAMRAIESTFAPVPGETANGTWPPLLAELINLGPLALLGPYAVSTLKLLPWFSDKPANVVKNTTMTLLRTSVAVAKTAPSSDERGAGAAWQLGSDDPGHAYFMIRAIHSWQDIAVLARDQQFNGTHPESVAILGEAMADGKLVEQAKWPVQLPFVPARPNLTAALAKTLFGFTIPALWRHSGTYAFVLDSGAPCDVDQPLAKYLDAATTNTTGACVDGKRYYLVHPGGSVSNGNGKFSAPPGLDKLPFYNNITTEDLIRGALRTWIPDGGNGTGAFADPTTNATAAGVMLDGEIPGPGVVRLPVCSAESAMRAWRAGPGANVTAVYPCAGPVTSAGGRVRYPGAAAAVVVLGLALFNTL
ncbi:hypothetical protein C8A05DRAFT_32845 [Staphylotrichum tortipilum]|uniref:Uncharacterized protein n=1 Tax=Staphylotrichum tortipilum TaxID=2831512 RepID=A0AAN6MM20_9PEZI|nr:hypothetical protein C8A05DRAFT_32845 [Staphylotrichum longicolle]